MHKTPPLTRLLIATILLFGFHSKTSIPTIEIRSVNKDILTYVRVDCSSFGDSFEKNEMKRKIIRGKEKVNDLISELEKLEIQDRKNWTDTRATITIKYWITPRLFVLINFQFIETAHVIR